MTHQTILYGFKKKFFDPLSDRRFYQPKFFFPLDSQVNLISPLYVYIYII